MCARLGAPTEPRPTLGPSRCYLAVGGAPTQVLTTCCLQVWESVRHMDALSLSNVKSHLQRFHISCRKNGAGHGSPARITRLGQQVGGGTTAAPGSRLAALALPCMAMPCNCLPWHPAGMASKCVARNGAQAAMLGPRASGMASGRGLCSLQARPARCASQLPLPSVLVSLALPFCFHFLLDWHRVLTANVLLSLATCCAPRPPGCRSTCSSVLTCASWLRCRRCTSGERGHAAACPPPSPGWPWPRGTRSKWLNGVTRCAHSVPTPPPTQRGYREHFSSRSTDWLYLKPTRAIRASPSHWPWPVRRQQEYHLQAAQAGQGAAPAQPRATRGCPGHGSHDHLATICCWRYGGWCCHALQLPAVQHLRPPPLLR